MKSSLRLLVMGTVLAATLVLGRAEDSDFPKVGALYEMNFLKESSALKNIRVAAISTKNPSWILVEELEFPKPGTGNPAEPKIVSRRWINLTFIVAASEIPFPS